MATTTLLMGWLASAAAASVAYPFTRYDVILRRQPFGTPPPKPPPAPAVPEPAAPVAPPPVARQLRLCAITESAPFGIRVGLVDIKSKQAYFLHVGDEQDGLELLEADYERRAAKLRKDGADFWISMDGAAAVSGPAPIAAGGSAPTPFAGGAVTKPAASAARPALAAASKAPYAERLKRRREILEERRQRSRELEAIGAEALKAQLMEYQMDLIRAGGELGPPLPIPLTKEADDQLVSEGALPPQAPGP